MAISLSDQLSERIEAEIVSGRMPPGARLDEQMLAARFGTSRTPVREALKRLAAQGLVEIRPHQGAEVVALSIPRMMEMFEVNAALEGLCARLAARRMSVPEREELAGIQRRCSELVGSGDADAYYQTNVRLHEAIYAGSHNAFLEAETRRVRNRLASYRRRQLDLIGRIPSSHAEHGAIVDAILRGDPDAAEELMRRHINIQGDRLSDLLAAFPRQGALP